MRAFLLFIIGIGLAMPAQAADLLNQPPPCVPPADLAAGGADLDPAKEAAAGTVPADLTAPPGIDLDVPLYLPPSQGRPGPNSAAGAADGTTGATPSTSDLVQAGTPVGGVAIRGGKAVSVQMLGKEQLPGAAGTPAAPACQR